MKHCAILSVFAVLVIAAVCVLTAPVGLLADQPRDEPLGPDAEIVSDDFNSCTLNTDVWEFINPPPYPPGLPPSHATMEMVGAYSGDAWLEINVPADESHDIWQRGNYAPRVMQDAPDSNFEIEVKFSSGLTGWEPPTTTVTVASPFPVLQSPEELAAPGGPLMPEGTFQMQGVLVEQGSSNFLRFDFHSKSGYNTKLLIVGVTPDGPYVKPEVLYQKVIDSADVSPLYMRVKRQGDKFTVSYATPSVTWTEVTTDSLDNYPITVTKVGAYASSTGVPTPGFTGQIDYFFNRSSPIIPEDGEVNTLTITDDGNGTITKFPDKASYGCGTGSGEVVTLTPQPKAGYQFSEWTGPDSGDVVDNLNGTYSITMDRSKVLVANFVPSSAITLTVTKVGSGDVTIIPDQATYNLGDKVVLIPVPAAGWTFDSWTGPNAADVLPEAGGTWSIVMNATKQVTANFNSSSEFRSYLPIAIQNY